MYKLVNHKLYLFKLIRPSLTVEAAIAVRKSMILSLIVSDLINSKGPSRPAETTE